MKINKSQHITKRGVVKRNPSKINQKELEYAYQLGVNAFNSGKKSIPHLDMELNKFMEKKKFKVGESIPYLKKWADGWHKTNLRTPAYKCTRCKRMSDVSSIKGLCEDCQEEDDNMNYCVTCGDKLSPAELKNGEDTCYPCQKGNTPESQEEARRG